MPRTNLTLLLSLILAACGTGKDSGPEIDSKSDETQVSDVGTEIIIECEAGLVYWPTHGICAPPVGKAEGKCDHPWELPRVGGGCSAIGPRACPKLWDPAAGAVLLDMLALNVDHVG